MTFTYDTWDSCYGVVTSRGAEMIYLDLDNGELARARELMNVTMGSRVLCSVVRPSIGNSRAIVKLESVVEYAA